MPEFIDDTNKTYSLKKGLLSISFLMSPKPDTTYPPKGGLADCRALVQHFTQSILKVNMAWFSNDLLLFSIHFFLRHSFVLSIRVSKFFLNYVLIFLLHVRKSSTTYRYKATGWMLELLYDDNTTYSIKRTFWLSLSFLLAPKPDTTYPPKGGLAEYRVLATTFDAIYSLS